jgi:3-hydroxy acid dehydrogenase/malonic semialdehyde reductase
MYRFSPDRRRLGTATSLFALAFVLGTSPAVAQDSANVATAAPQEAPAAEQDRDSSEIVVTGSRIVANGFNAPTPTTVIGEEQIANNAQPNIFNTIQQLPSLQGSTGASTGTFSTSLFAAVDDTLGGIDMLVSCAALGADPIDEMDDADWRYVFDTNLAAYLACAKRAIARMEANGGGHLLFIGSISPEIEAVGESVYAATKAGVQAFAETLRKEVADRNIKVSVMQPGSVDTDMQQCAPAEKVEAVAGEEVLEPAEIADAVLFVLTRSVKCDIVHLRIEPLLQETA